MKDYKDLGHELEGILGMNHIYYQAPSNVRMEYPAIRYQEEPRRDRKADNVRYAKFKRYSLTHIYKDPEEDLSDRILEAFPFASWSSRSISDGLYQDRYEVYYG